MSDLRFDDRAVIVTGAERGMGHALSRAAKGATVVVADNGGDIDGSGRSRTRGGHAAMQLARPSDQSARGLLKPLEACALFARHGVGVDARMLLVANRLLSGKALHRVTRPRGGHPTSGALRPPGKVTSPKESDKYG